MTEHEKKETEVFEQEIDQAQAEDVAGGIAADANAADRSFRYTECRYCVYCRSE